MPISAMEIYDKAVRISPCCKSSLKVVSLDTIFIISEALAITNPATKDTIIAQKKISLGSK